MTPYCTSDFELEFPELDFDLVDKIVLTIKQGDVKLERTEESMTVSGHVIALSLTQQDTRAFAPGYAELQVNFLLTTGKRISSDIATVNVDRNLHMEVMT